MCKVPSYHASRRFSTILLGSLFCASAAFAEVVTEPLAGHPEWGYTVSGLGESGDETAVVFTNHTETATWTVPTDLTDVQFLVVGGGGGGGGGTWGPGGGGGGVVTGLVYSLTKNAEVVVTVGAGGDGGAYNSRGKSGGNSSISVGGVMYVTANGGGTGKTATDGGSGGSGAGGGAKSSTSYKGGSATQGSYDSNLVSAEKFGMAGGVNGSSSYCSGGGGGATKVGGNGSGTSTTNGKGGDGGAGLNCDITGSDVVYGSGGGGSGIKTKGQGGSGAGNGAYGNASPRSATAGVANQGGGGGGGGKISSPYNIGAAGGSGIVVFRYKVASNIAVVPTFDSKVYTGETLTADVSDGTGYTVTQNNGGIDVGDYDVVLTLVDGYTWDVGEFSGTLTFSITQAANVWTVEPAISKGSWTQGVDEPGVLTAGETQFGTVAATITKDGGEATTFGGALPTEAGEYVVTYATAATANYTAPDAAEKSVSFTIYSADEIPPYELSLGAFSVNGERTLSVPYSIACDVTTTKAADIYVRYALDGDETSNTVKIASAVALNGGTGTGTIADLKPDATYWVDAYAVVDQVQSDATALDSVKVPGSATDFTASATFTNDPKEFTISGSVTPGLGTTTVTVGWSLNSDALDNSETFTFAYGEEGAFTRVVPYTDLSDSLTWRVSVANTVTTETWGEQSFSGGPDVSGTKRRLDVVNTTYTWTGAGGDNFWTNIANWSASASECIGYPGTRAADGYDRSTAIFTSTANGAVIDLDGGTFTGRDEGESIKFDDDAGEIKFVDGTLDFNYSGYVLGAFGTTVVFENVSSDNRLTIASGATVVFEGDTVGTWTYRPRSGYSNTRLVIRNGTLSSGAFAADTTIASSHTVEISNAIWSISGKVDTDQAIANTVTFRDGADYQARFVASGELQLKGTYDIAIPRGGHSLASLTGSTLTSGSSSATFRVDVTDFTSQKKVPIATFTSTTDQSSKYASKTVNLVATAGGVDVTEKRNARLVWSEEDNTLYYQQDSKSGFVVIIQ